MDDATLVIGAGIVVLAFIAYKVVRGGVGDAVFVVTVRGEGPENVQVKGTTYGKSHGDVQDFVARMELPKGAKIWGIRDGDQIRLRFSSHVPDNLQQRTRNFFLN